MRRTGRYLFTSESVTEGHPDKIADQVSDGVLDAVLAQDPNGRVACESLLTTNLIVLAGEITTDARVDYAEVAREAVRDVGYTDQAFGFDANRCDVQVKLHEQSGDIAMGVDPGGAGDQGLMFGYACTGTQELMPMPIMLAHRLVRALSTARRSGLIDHLRPDGKSQVTVEYEGDEPKRIDKVVVSSQHAESVPIEAVRADIERGVIRPTLPPELVDDETVIHINPTGRFVTGGPAGDCGLTGRKIIVDTYGGMAPHGGGAFSGKDPTKVDRSAAYMARYIAKNCVAAGLADRVQVQLAYAIGIADPMSVLIDTFGTGTTDMTDGDLGELVQAHFALKPREIIETLDLRRPIYRQTARFGHFGREDAAFTWERTDRADALRSAAGVQEREATAVSS